MLHEKLRDALCEADAAAAAPAGAPRGVEVRKSGAGGVGAVEEAREGQEASQDAPGSGEVSEWLVVHSRVVKRQEPSVEAKMDGILTQGKLVRGVTVSVSGEEWLRVQEKEPDGGARTVYLLISGESLGLGPLLERAPFVMREAPGRGMALFAQRDFDAGEIVVDDRPFFTRPKPREIQKRAEFNGDWPDAFARIKEKLVYPWGDTPEGEDIRIHASPAMVRNAIGFAGTTSAVRQQILDLAHPDVADGHPLVKIAGRVADLCTKFLPECRGLKREVLQRGILSIEMNIFAGGRLFTTLSRANHSCLPNMVYIGMPGEWKFKALRPIQAGEELLHSYLGEELLLPTELRRRHLWRSKCFECACERCAAEAETMRDVPCRRCLASPEAGMPETGEADEAWAVYALGRFIFKPDSLPDFDKPSEETQDWMWLPSQSWHDVKAQGPYASFTGSAWRCPVCGESPVGGQDAVHLATERQLGRLAEKTFYKPTIMPPTALGAFKSRYGEIQLIKPEFVAYAMDLATTVWGVLGLKHWASQWARMFMLDVVITKLEFCTTASAGDRQTLLSYLVGTTNALWEWILSLGLTQDPSCFILGRAEAVKTFAFHHYSELSDSSRLRLSELNQRIQNCYKQVEILPMRPLLVDGSVCMS